MVKNKLQKIITNIIFVIIAILFVSFALSNDEIVMFKLWPFPYEISVPIFLPILIVLAVGFFCGMLYSLCTGKKNSDSV